nr:hypothetical protein [Tanacetum cinerariifolium]
MEDDMLKFQIKVDDILYELELIYHPALFDIMIHLVIHLPLEDLKGGPIRPNGMFPFERYMKKLKVAEEELVHHGEPMFNNLVCARVSGGCGWCGRLCAGGGGEWCGGRDASETFWMWIFLWKDIQLRQLMSSLKAPFIKPSTHPSYSSGPSIPPSYSLGPSTPPNYSSRSSRNAECSNSKNLGGKIIVLKATMDMHMQPEQHTVNSAALLHEVLNEMEKLDLE